MFQDRGLAPLEKRALMRFMGSAQGHVAGLQSGGEEGLRGVGVDPEGGFGGYLEGQELPARLRYASLEQRLNIYSFAFVVRRNV